MFQWCVKLVQCAVIEVFIVCRQLKSNTLVLDTTLSVAGHVGTN